MKSFIKSQKIDKTIKNDSKAHFDFFGNGKDFYLCPLFYLFICFSY